MGESGVRGWDVWFVIFRCKCRLCTNHLRLNLHNAHNILDNNIQLVQIKFYLYLHKRNYNLFQSMKYNNPIFHLHIFLLSHLYSGSVVKTKI